MDGERAKVKLQLRAIENGKSVRVKRVLSVVNFQPFFFLFTLINRLTDGFCQTRRRRTSATEVERNHKMVCLELAPNLSAVSHTIRLDSNPPAKKEGSEEKAGKRRPSALKRNDERCRRELGVWQVQRRRSLPSASADSWNGINISMCV